ncbi:MAG: helix-turn-helix domain-containing protein [Lachnospiraceae bacterium]|nr:helix-turn-helix domain-containing protein [Lachnospiraceae bacterium]
MKNFSPLFGTIIKESRKKAGLSQLELSKKMKVTRNTVINWEADKYKPEHDLIPKLCKILSISPNLLYDFSAIEGLENFENENKEDLTLFREFSSLSSSGKRVVSALIYAMLAEEGVTKNNALSTQNINKNNAEKLRCFELHYTSAAAGTGFDYSDEKPGSILLKENPRNANADAVIAVHGDSMLPAYHDGDYVYVKYTNSVYPGEDVICRTPDGQVIKRVTADYGLQSVNPALPYDETYSKESIQLLGRVIGIVNPLEFPED